MKAYPKVKPPNLTAQGNYCPHDLRRYRDEAQRAGLPPFKMAEDLRVDIDRVHYLLGPDSHLIFRRRHAI